MGCGESKQDVVTGNTILRRKKSDPDPKKSKDIETILETNTEDNTTNSSVQQQQQQAENEENKYFGGAVAADAKDINENTAVKEGYGDKHIDKGKEGGEVEEKEADGRLISHDSPNHYFSSRKNEEGIDGIVSEGRSEESDYYSPSHTAGKEDLLSENVKTDKAVKGKELVKETKAENENGETVKVKEETLMKDAEPKTIVEAKVSNLTSEEKNHNADQEEHKADTPTKDENKK